MDYPARRFSRYLPQVDFWRTPTAEQSHLLDWSADLTMLRLTLFTSAAFAVMMVLQGLTVPLSDTWQPVATCAALLAVAAFYQAVRPEPSFVLTCKALTVLVGFSTVYSLLMYTVATTGRPLSDQMLLGADSAVGLSAPDLVRWIDARPALAQFFQVIYFSLIPQTILVVVVLGLTNRAEKLDRFLVRFMLGCLISLIGFYFWPALGTCGDGQLPVPSHYAPTIEHIEAMRSGTTTSISWRGAQGLIEFPSFHTIWAVLLASAFARTRLFWPMAVLNALVVVSTIPTGMHYFVDVWAGLAISAVVIAGTRGHRASELAAG
jgi:membrane-associated phospholipid phosphatase